jgi:dGTPase
MSEDALSPYVSEGFEHSVWGADVVLARRNLCLETADGIRNHSWSRPAPATPEGEVVSWADRIAYVCHDFEDALRAGIVSAASLPPSVRDHCGATRAEQLSSFIGGLVECVSTTGYVGMADELAGALADFRECNYERIYLRPASVSQGQAAIAVLRALVEHFIDRPNLLPGARGADLVAGSTEAARVAVTYVGGMTDRFAFRSAVALLGWDPAKLPESLGVA